MSDTAEAVIAAALVLSGLGVLTALPFWAGWLKFPSRPRLHRGRRRGKRKVRVG